MRFPLLVCVFVSVIAVIASPLLAQSPNGNINGLVSDPSGAAVAGAELVAVNDVTGVQYTTKSNNEGIYVLPSLPPGPYRLQVSKIGFKTLIKPDIVLNVQDSLSINFTLLVGAFHEIVTVQGGAPLVNVESASVSTVIDRNLVESLPLNGRSFNTLLQLTPGVVISPLPLGGYSQGQFSVAGQRADSNNFTLDGVSANFGVSASFFAGTSGTGSAQAFSALGGTSSLVSVDALQEFRIETSTFAPEFGRQPGGQVILNTRSGTNSLHGSVFDYFRNTVMDANNWFADAAGLPRAPEQHNDFGGVLGGPIWKGKTFFFASYEGARLREPQTSVTQVPSANVRVASSTPSQIRPFLNAYPNPNGSVSSDGNTAQFTGNWSNAASLDATSIRIDQHVGERLSLFGRYNYAPSHITTRGAYALSVSQREPVNTQTLTAGLTLSRNRITNNLRGNYSQQDASLLFSMDSFGGAVPLNSGLTLGPLSTRSNEFNFNIADAAPVDAGPNGRNRVRQANSVDDLIVLVGTHQLKFGADYRLIFLDTAPRNYSLQYFSASVENLISTSQARLSTSLSRPAEILVQAFSTYAQDTWRVTPRLTMTYGLRWELSPPPSGRAGTQLASWTGTSHPSEIMLAPAGTPLWNTTLGNLAPRLGFAYSLNDRGDFVIRAGGGLFYDLAVGESGNLAGEFPNSTRASYGKVSVPITDVTQYLPVLSSAPPYPYGVEGYISNLRLPRSYQWNLSIEKSIRGQQSISATYVGQAGRKLLRQETSYQPNPAFSGELVLTGNDAWSNYDALQLQLRRSLSSWVHALLNYTWSHSLDSASNDVDVLAGLSNTIIPANTDYGPSDFDIRHTFSGGFVFEPPAAPGTGLSSRLTRNWSLAGVVVARSGFPFNARLIFESADPGGYAFTRPDLVPGQPLWIRTATAPGAQVLNGSAFGVPSPIRQGTEGRNDITGFGLTQVDLSLAKRFGISDRVSVLLRLDAFNVLNHPNFSNPSGFFEFGASGLESTQMLNQGLGGLNPLFQEGGPRSLQVSARLSF